MAAISKSAVIYVTVLFCGVVGLQTVMPVTMAERPAFYREQQSEMYSVAVYSFVTSLVEVYLYFDVVIQNMNDVIMSDSFVRCLI